MIRTSRYREEHVGQRRHADPPTAERKAAAVTKEEPGVRARQFAGGPLRHGTLEVRRPFERAIVMDDDDAVAREVHVELEAVGAERQAVVERRERVFRGERAAASMREDERPRRRKKGVKHLKRRSLPQGHNGQTQRRRHRVRW